MKYLSLVLFLIITLIHFINAAQERNILWNEFDAKKSSIDNSLNGVNVWKNKLKTQIQDNLTKIPENIKKLIIEKAENQTKTDWPSLLVTEYLQFVINGNRDHYESSRNRRREKLINLVFGEMLTGNGKYMNHIVDGLWLVLEESTWTLPAHLYMQKAGYGLPDPTEYEVDLGVAATSSYIAWIKFVLGINFVYTVLKYS
jgi:uncharacterized protein YeeX (DUF496 family)